LGLKVAAQVVDFEILMYALGAELKQVAERRETLHKSHMKFLDECCRRAQDRVDRLSNIKSMEQEKDEQDERCQLKLCQLRDHRVKLQRFVTYMCLSVQ